MNRMNMTMSTGNYSNNNQISNPTPTFQVMSAMPFSKRKFSATTLSSQTAYNVPRDASVYNPSKNLRHAITTPVVNDKVPVMLWGKPTWHLLHTMAEKIQNIPFSNNRSEILQIIYTICINLPCPTCAEHAKEYMIKHKLFQIMTKNELKMFLFKFHNSVNVRKHMPIFDEQNLTQYARAIPKNIIEHFLIAYNRKSKNIRLLADDMHRENITTYLKGWFQRYIQYFDGPITSL